MNAVTTIQNGSLSYLDWKIIEMAREDGPRSFNPDGLAAKLARLVGLSVPQGLANERLETLRRFGVRAWYWDLIRNRDLDAFVSVGFSRSDAAAIVTHVAAVRGFRPSIQDEAASPA